MIEQYEKDHTTTTTNKNTTTTTTTATTTTAATTTTTAATTGTTSADTDKEDSSDADKEEEEEEETDPNRVNTTIDAAGDEDFTNALKTVEIGKAKVITYKKGGTTLTAALVLRMDPEEGLGAYKYDDEREGVIYGIAFEEFDKEVEETIEKMTVTENKRAIRMADVDEFRD